MSLTTSRNQLLKIATSLVKTHGFTREALSHSVLLLPAGKSHSEPLADHAISALFGVGDRARVVLINAWLDEGLKSMRSVSSPTVQTVLKARLDYNRGVLEHLPQAFAILASPEQGLPPVDPRPALKHAAKIADEACHITGDTSLHLAWYSKRASLAMVYSAAELHQLTSPDTAHGFLDSLLSSSAVLNSSLGEVQLFSSYLYKSWGGILKSKSFL
ncbi:ubiquinone biosynthesis protein coq9 [Moniliophthora roreri MCA 2997]|uniref:Ubiquinone biosynthesis protein n=2 Tax=Moniliophthora roreri TaxID=221103 RepID=V2XJR3_MONRO|nr:ubiquinone biosynthesis protein coq9 [Moniliophthora roreri MCA 2997]KAI3608057.1 ubiquinone biosynthesis protein coq9 [Moniliophthora roreri]